jgi:thiol-disulfide isomerase/thioredoxin
VLLCLLAAVASAGANAGSSRDVDFTGWFDGLPGMIEAGRLYEQKPRPIFIYFYTDWCGYCRQLERELLSHDLVDEYLDDILAVRINPEAGATEMQVAQRYGVTGFPSLFVLSGESKTLSSIDRMTVKNGRSVLVSPSAFVDLLKTAAAR